jgi:LuxR family maltose regulon positive regulatory protein
MAVEVGAAQRRIIRRPRLTSMLDDSSARIRLLIAPAGYGKTTLAREWLGEPERRAVWYRGGPASADVAALAAGIAEAASEIIPDAGKRMRDRLRATGHPEEDVDILAELFAEDVQEWPSDAWLAFDDYQFAMESAASERFVDLLTQQTPMQMLITSRRRPSWATARRILYGEILEIDRRALAMEDSEARALLDRSDAEVAEVLERARGWPAVIGLVALNANLGVASETLPDQLYDYFAQELYEALFPADRVALGELSFATRFDRSFASSVLGARAEGAIDAGIRSGILTEPIRNTFEIHPLLSELLQEQAFVEAKERQHAAERVGQILLKINRWDDAFDLAVRFRLHELLLASIEHSLEALIDLGRIATVARWLEAAASLHCQSPILDLAEAEVAFRFGDHARAEALASQAAKHLRQHRLASRAFVRAGHGALLASREGKSIEYFHSAAQTARGPRERREALYGLYSAMSELELPDATAVLEELKMLEVETPDDFLRSLAVKLIQAVRAGEIQETLVEVQHDLHVLEKATDPLITTSFLHSFSNALSMGGHYDRAFEVTSRLHDLTKRHRLDFARPFAYLDRAVAQIGQRRFGRATRDLESAHRALPPAGDVHIEGNLTAIHCRLLTAMGRTAEAIERAQVPPTGEPATAPLEAEIRVSQAAALACASQKADALAALAQAETVSATSLVVQVLGPAVRAICASENQERRRYAHDSWRAAQQTGNFDSLVTAYRGHASLLPHLAKVAGADRLAIVLRRAKDVDLAREWGIAMRAVQRAHRTPLTARETEVINLVAAGLSNKETAQSLYVAEATIKVHLRHIYEKLGVRGRTEAVAKWLAPQ